MPRQAGTVTTQTIGQLHQQRQLFCVFSSHGGPTATLVQNPRCFKAIAKPFCQSWRTSSRLRVSCEQPTKASAAAAAASVPLLLLLLLLSFMLMNFNAINRHRIEHMVNKQSNTA
jgi:hypothetical protein